MSVLDGPGEGTWSVFAAKVVEERDALRDQLENVLDSHVEGCWQARCLDAERELAKAQAKAADYERDWYAAKSKFGSAMAKMRDALRAAEKRELEALAELDAATAILVAVAKLLMANGCDCECGHDSEGHDDCERCFACKVSDAIGKLA